MKIKLKTMQINPKKNHTLISYVTHHRQKKSSEIEQNNKKKTRDSIIEQISSTVCKKNIPNRKKKSIDQFSS